MLRRQEGQFDLIYLHRVSNAIKYGELARYHNPKARQVFSVADLHHLRYARQSEAEGRPELVALSRRTRFVEFVAAVSADAVITHSAQEAEIFGEANSALQNSYRDVVDDAEADASSICRKVRSGVYRQLRSRSKPRCVTLAD